jgi:endonuclease/exonuclease/phosphatase (EEP) superfamily protein YafD
MRWYPGEDFKPVRLFAYVMPWLLVILLPGAALAFLAHQRLLSLFLLVPTLIIGANYMPLFMHCAKSEASDQPSMKVMSYNVWAENKNIAQSVQLILQQRPDILFVQELIPEKFDRFIDGLKDLYLEKALNVHYIAQMNQAIVSRYRIFPLEAADDKGRAQVARIDSPWGDMTAINVHVYKWPYRFRNRELSRLLQENIVGIDGPIVLAGDFNTNEQTKAYKMIAKYLKNGHRQTGCGFGFTFPSNARRIRGHILPALIRIDHIFYSRQFRSIRSTTLSDSGGSDHFPLVSVLVPNQEMMRQDQLAHGEYAN